MTYVSLFPNSIDYSICGPTIYAWGLPWGLSRNPPANTRDMDLIPGWGRSPGEENGSSL